jgi:hypothetical protein
MDALSDVLRVAHLTGGVFLHAEFSAPWCVASRVAPEHCGPVLGSASHLIPYHYVIEGELHFRVECEERETFTLGTRAVVLMLRNDLHVMGSDLSLPQVTASDLIRPPSNGGLLSIRHGGDGARTQMICGFLGCDGAEDSPIISALPPALKLDLERGAAAEWIQSTFQYAAEEVAAGRPGSETVLAKLSELLFVEAATRLTPPRKLQPGAILLRNWGGVQHQVTVLQDGVEFRGKQYRSLSEVARIITGSRWSGPLFFGLKRRSREATGDGAR